MKTSPTLQQLKAFNLVVSHGSFSAAAKHLDLSQPAVSLQVRQLERWLGIRLVERVGRNVRPTAAGEELTDYARRIEITMTAAVEAMQRHTEGTVGRVRLGTGATACIYFLPSVLRSLRSVFPSLDIIVSTGNTADVLKSVEENTIDVGL